MMSRKYDVILFDLDGTLTDPGVGITNSVMYALKKYNIEVAERSSLYKFIGPPLHESFMKYYGFSDEEAAKAVAYYREYFSDTGIFENAVYEGVVDMLEALKASGYRLVLATSKPTVFANRILEHFGLASYFEYVAGANIDGSRTKKDDVIAHAIETCSLNISRTLMIGDRKHDILGAKEHGMDSVGVLYGYGDYEELKKAGADYITEKPAGIKDLLQTN